MKKSFILFLLPLLLSSSFYLFSQPVNNFTGDVSMPSPSAASLGRFIDAPVGSFQGTSPISVPLTTINDGSLSLGVSLQYHNGGVKIGQPSGRYGVNWQNTAENSLSVSVQGKPDVYAGGYYYGAPPDPANDFTAVKDAADAELDSEPDLYSYSLPNTSYSGKFYFENGNAVFVPLADLHVEVLDSNRYIIISPEGVRYHYGVFGNYGGQELIINEGDPLANPFPSTYHLAKIESYDRENAIFFEYVNENYSYYQKSACLYSYSYCQGVSGGGTAGNICNVEWTKNTVIGARLDKITTADGTKRMTFYTGAVRDDLDGVGASMAREIDHIEIETGSGEAGNYWCNRFDFDFDYWVATGGSGPTNSNDFRRLRLLEVQEVSCSTNEVVAPYRFSYVGYNTHSKMTADSANLPRRMSNAIDHWGFWNGVATNQKPNIPFTVLTLPGGNTFSYGQSDREANDKYSVAAVLDTIYYPWGGYTAYDYQGNTVKEITETVIDDFFFISDTAVISDPNQCPYVFFDEATVTMTGEQAATAKIEVCGYDPETCTFNQGFNFNIHADSLIAGGGWGDIRTFSWGGQQTSCLPQNGTTSLDVFFNYNFVAGTTYRFQLDGVNGGGSFRIFYTETDTINRTVGGVRVAKILHHDDVSTANDIVYEFDYSDPDDEGWSSGQLMRDIQYGYNVTAYGDGGGEFESIVFSDVPVTPLSTFQGYEMGYRRVTQIQPNNGRKVSKFYAVKDQATTNQFPFAPLPLFYRNGQAFAHQTFTETDPENALAAQFIDDRFGNQLPVDEVSNTVMFKARKLPCSGADATFYLYTTYNIHTNVFRPVEVLDTLDGVATQTNYTYLNRNSSIDHLFPTATEFVGSENEIVKTQYEYVFDFIGTTDTTAANQDVYHRMADKLNLISNPVRVTQSVNGNDNVVGGSWTNWRFYQAAGVNLEFGAPLLSNATFDNANRIPYAYEYLNYEADFIGNLPPTYDENNWASAAINNLMNFQVHKPIQVTIDGWQMQEYTWSPGTRMLTQSKYLNHIKSYQYYNGTTKRKQETGIDGQFIYYNYDGLGRLAEITARHTGGNLNVPKVITTIDYQYPDASNERAYVRTTVDYATAEQLGSQSALNQQIVYDYLDGLGRSIQQLQQQYASEDAHDIVTITDYDARGRVEQVYEPFSTDQTNGSFYTGSLTGKAFTYQEYEPSPLNRSLATTPPNWFLPTVTTYGTNESIDNVETLPITSTSNGTYNIHQLRKQTVTDPEGKFVTTFTDKRGRTVMVERGDATDAVRTYYEYDEKDRERFIYPPNSDTGTPQLIYEKSYTADDNVAYQKIPDRDAIIYRYDARDLPIVMQDGNMAVYAGKTEIGRHLITEYDDYGRPVATGFGDGMIPSNLANLGVDDYLTETYYDGQSTTTTETDPIYTGRVRQTRAKLLDGAAVGTDWMETINNYNQYGQLFATESNNPLHPSTSSDIIDFKYDFADNLLQRSRELFANTGTIPQTITQNDHHYDHQGRKIKEFYALDGGAGLQLCEQDYTDKDLPNQKLIGAKTGGGFLQTVDYTYNDRRWLTEINDPENLADDLFSLRLQHKNLNGNFGTGIGGQNNGNISQQIWKTASMSTNEVRTYAYKYDYLDRLTEARYGNGIFNAGFSGNADLFVTNNNNYTSTYEYDVRGNIKSLTRRGQLSNGNYGLIDQLTYHPNDFDLTNQIQFINDAIDINCPTDENLTTNQNEDRCVEVDNTITSTQTIGNNANVIYRAGQSITLNNGFEVSAGSEFLAEVRPCRNKFAGFVDGGGIYAYDENGNMTVDPDKGIAIKYNHLNLPYEVDFGDGRKIEWLYDASGQKWQKIGEETKNYFQDIEYMGTILDAIYHTEGRISFSSGSAEYQYSLVDHLGNTRVMFKDNGGTPEIIQENHYYAFGLEQQGAWNGDNVSDYTFGGKELNEDFGLGWLDFENRHLNPSIARFITIDPKTEFYPSISGNTYTANNPIRLIDPTGMVIIVGGQEWNKGEDYKIEDENDENNAFYQQVFGILNFIADNSESGASWLSELSTSEFKFNVVRAEEGVSSRFIPDNEPKVVDGKYTIPEASGGTAHINDRDLSKIDTENGKVEDMRFTMVHEIIGHGVDAKRGKNDVNPGRNGLPQSEYNASYRENMVRAETGNPLRKTYFFRNLIRWDRKKKAIIDVDSGRVIRKTKKWKK